MPNNPIVTVKLHSASLDRSVGSDIRIKLQAEGGPVVERIGASTKDRWIFQKATTSAAVSIHIEVTEGSEPHPETVSSDKTLNIDISKPPKRDSDVADLVLKAVGGDKGKTANFSFTFDWFVNTNVESLLTFIHSRMLINLESSEFLSMKKAWDQAGELSNAALNTYYSFDPEMQEAIAQTAGVTNFNSLWQFKEMVKGGADWDFKKIIQDSYGDWALDAPRGRIYKFDVWSNIHYGYIGKAIGYSDLLLLNSAGIAQALKENRYNDALDALTGNSGREQDEPGDGAAIQIGIGLWTKYGARVTKENILESIRKARSRIHSKRADEGRPPDSFLP